MSIDSTATLSPPHELRRATTTATTVTHVPGSKCHPCSGWTRPGGKVPKGGAGTSEVRRLRQGGG